MKNDNKANVQSRKGYSVSYIENLLKIVGRDVQDNNPVFEEDYMTVALEACREFNETFAEENFDVDIK